MLQKQQCTSRVNKDTLRRCLNTLLVLVIIRILCCIPTPGVNTDYFSDLFSDNAAYTFINILSGSGLSSLSVMALSIGPYITASILTQVGGALIPAVKKLQRGDKKERELIEKINILLGALAAIGEGLAMAIQFGKNGMLKSSTTGWIITVTLIWTVFAVATSITGVQMTKKTDVFIGNGVSLILLSNIVSSYPKDGMTIWFAFGYGKKPAAAILSMLIAAVIVLLAFTFTIRLNASEKRIPITYSDKIITKNEKIKEQSIPLKMCPGGVMPIIFASFVLSVPSIIGTLGGNTDTFICKLMDSSYWFKEGEMIYTIGALIYVGLIFGFSYIYAGITVNPKETARRIREAGGTLYGIRQGRDTEEYIKKESSLMIALGALGISAIAMIPVLLSAFFGISRLSFLGTSIIITTGVIVDTVQQIKASNRGSVYNIRVQKEGGLL